MKDKASPHYQEIGWQHVGGNHEAKLELTQLVELFKSPEQVKAMGAHIPRGILLYGPPGSGKTLLARATAREAGAEFISACGSEFIEM